MLIFQYLPDDAGDGENDGDVLLPDEKESKRRKSGLTTPVSEARDNGFQLIMMPFWVFKL